MWRCTHLYTTHGTDRRPPGFSDYIPTHLYVIPVGPLNAITRPTYEATILDRGLLASVASLLVPLGLGGPLIPVSWLLNSFVTG